MLRRPLKHVRNRKRLDPSLPPVFPNVSITSAVHATAGQVTVTFSAVVQATGQFGASTMTHTGVVYPCTATKQTSPTVVVFTYGTWTAAAADTLTMPTNDAAVRTAAGGFVVGGVTTTT